MPEKPFELIIDDKRVSKILKKYPEKAKAAVKKSLLESAIEVQNKAKKNAPYKSGNLRRSITHEAKADFAKVGTNVVYAPVHEFGATIIPKTAKFLRFKVGGRWVRTKKVIIPPYKGKGFLRPALKEKKTKIMDIFAKNIRNILKP